MVANLAIFAMAWLVGDNVQVNRTRVADLAERAGRAERERQAEALRAAGEERSRIARELHDIIAHSLSVMIVQAGGARRVLSREPGQAAEALASIESTGRQAMTEMRRLLGVLRDDRHDHQVSFAPQPSLSSLPALVEHCAAAGLRVSIEVTGAERGLPPGVDLSAFRIVQEALTNVLRHAGTATATVRVAYGDRGAVGMCRPTPRACPTVRLDPRRPGTPQAKRPRPQVRRALATSIPHAQREGSST